MDSEQRRKRKRPLKPTPPQTQQYYYYIFSVRSLLFCFSFAAASLFLLSTWFRAGSPSFRPVLIVSSLSLLSSSAINSIQHSNYDYSTTSSTTTGDSSSFMRIQDRVLFPDHVLVMVSDSTTLWNNEPLLDCVYHGNFDTSYENEIIRVGRLDSYRDSDETSKVRKDHDAVFKSALSVDEYDEFRSIVRCPLPPLNYSAATVNLQNRGRDQRQGSVMDVELLLQMNQTVNSWETVAYAAQLDGDTAVVFIKGLNLRPGRYHDPRQFVCHFGSGSRERDGRFVLTTRAITAAQEVVRCSLPASIQKNPEKAVGIRVSIGVASRFRANPNGKSLVYQSLPSVAKILNTGKYGKKNQEKYKLCVCTMVWNQASTLREWIMYHAWLGVQRWFIYDNNSDDGIKDAIEELDQENYNVSRHLWPWIKTQEAGFSHCTLRAKNKCKWVGFMDVDEFFYFPFPTPHHPVGSNSLGYPGQNSLQALVSNFSSSTAIAEIRTACHNFGPSGLRSPPSQGVTAGYTCRLQSPERHKSIVRPDALDDGLLNVVHHFRLRRGFRYLNLPRSTVVLNHYKYQVWETFRTKFFRRVATYVADWRENQNEGSRDRAPGLGTEAIEPPNWELQFCEVWDTGLRDFVLANLADTSATGLLPWQKPLQ